MGMADLRALPRNVRHRYPPDPSWGWLTPSSRTMAPLSRNAPDPSWGWLTTVVWTQGETDAFSPDPSWGWLTLHRSGPTWLRPPLLTPQGEGCPGTPLVPPS